MEKYKQIGFGIVIVVLIIVFNIGIPLSKVYGATVDDVRDLYNKQRVDSLYTEEELREITNEYLKIERQNAIVRMFELSKKIIVERDVEKRAKLLDKVNKKRDEFVDAYKSGVDLEKVLKIKTELDSLLVELNKLRNIEDSDLELNYVPNIWTKQYEEAQQVIEALDSAFDIGLVGIDLDPPVRDYFVITSHFGLRHDPFNKDVIAFHSGLDLKADEGDIILAQWNGVVSNVYTSEIGGNVIEIMHGKNLKTRYLHLSEVLVSIGDEVRQYDVIGKAGSTGRATGPHLHFEVYLDGEKVDPIYLYGKKGANVLLEYKSRNPDSLLNVSEIIKNIKDYPTNRPTRKTERKNVYVHKDKYDQHIEELEGTIKTTLPEDYTPPNPSIVDIKSLPWKNKKVKP